MPRPLDYGALLEAGRINTAAHQAVERALSAGVTGRELNAIASTVIARLGGTPSFPDVGFPATICVSVNDVIGHGIPGDAAIAPGDIVKIDIGVGVTGMHTDCARTYWIGPLKSFETDDPDQNASTFEPGPVGIPERLIAATEHALWAGIAAAEPGRRVSDISNAIAQHIAGTSFALFRHAFGHGVGETLHESPQIPNFGPANRGPRLRVGQVIAIEPVLVTGLPYKRRPEAAWGDRTIDGGIAAHFEDTILVSSDGPLVITRDSQSADVITAHQPELATFLISEGILARPKAAEDNPWILDMARSEMNAVLIEAWGRPVNPQEVLNPEDSQTIVLQQTDGTPMGFFAIRHEPACLHLVTLVISRQYQGLGIGSKVMKWMERRAVGLRKRHVQLWVQTSNKRAIRFYERLGYYVFATPVLATLAMRKHVSPRNR